jgi:vancomycin resistance protein VanW
MSDLQKQIQNLVINYEKPKRKAISSIFPKLAKPIIAGKRVAQSTLNWLNPQVDYRRQKEYFPAIVARHQSVLRRKLGDSDQRLQEQKVKNLAQAVKALNGAVIEPGKVFSLWQIIGQPTFERGYANGMLLSGGKVVEGMGGGLCQLSNFLFWILMHTPMKIIQRYHHSMDVFPDSGRVLPFGSGATILYNFIDLKLQNTSKQPLQIKIWLTDKYLKGQILSSKHFDSKLHLREKHHYFVKSAKQFYRYNQIWQIAKKEGQIINSRKLLTNFAPVLYSVDPEYLAKNNFRLLKVKSQSPQGIFEVDPSSMAITKKMLY